MPLINIKLSLSTKTQKQRIDDGEQFHVVGMKADADAGPIYVGDTVNSIDMPELEGKVTITSKVVNYGDKFGVWYKVS